MGAGGGRDIPSQTAVSAGLIANPVRPGWRVGAAGACLFRHLLVLIIGLFFMFISLTVGAEIFPAGDFLKLASCL